MPNAWQWQSILSYDNKATMLQVQQYFHLTCPGIMPCPACNLQSDLSLQAVHKGKQLYYSLTERYRINQQSLTCVLVCKHAHKRREGDK